MNAQMFENLALLASSDPRFEKYSLNLNQDELNFIKKLLENNPEFFEAISKELSAIMEDGKKNDRNRRLSKCQYIECYKIYCVLHFGIWICSSSRSKN